MSAARSPKRPLRERQERLQAHNRLCKGARHSPVSLSPEREGGRWAAGSLAPPQHRTPARALGRAKHISRSEFYPPDVQVTRPRACTTPQKKQPIPGSPQKKLRFLPGERRREVHWRRGARAVASRVGVWWAAAPRAPLRVRSAAPQRCTRRIRERPVRSAAPHSPTAPRRLIAVGSNKCTSPAALARPATQRSPNARTPRTLALSLPIAKQTAEKDASRPSDRRAARARRLQRLG